MAGLDKLRVSFALHKLGRHHRSSTDRNDLIVLAVQDESRYIKPLKILSEVGLGERFDAFVGCGHSLTSTARENCRASPERLWRQAGWSHRKGCKISDKRLRAVFMPARRSSNSSIGRPLGFASVFCMNGGTAAIRIAFATRLVPWRPM